MTKEKNIRNFYHKKSIMLKFAKNHNVAIKIEALCHLCILENEAFWDKLLMLKEPIDCDCILEITSSEAKGISYNKYFPIHRKISKSLLILKTVQG